MSREMLINVSEGEECRVAVVEDGSLEELYIERSSLASHVGNIYKGRVVNVEPGIQAAFIDFGAEKNGFLHISDLHPRYFGQRESVENIGRHKHWPTVRRFKSVLRKARMSLSRLPRKGSTRKGQPSARMFPCLASTWC